LKRASEEFSWVVGRGGECMAGIVPADHAGVEKPLRLDPMLPAGATIAELANKASGASGDEVQIAELRGSARLDLIEGTEDRYGMWVTLQRSLPTPADIGNFAFIDWHVSPLSLIYQWRWAWRHYVIFPHPALKVRSQQIGVVSFRFQICFGFVALGAKRLEFLFPEAFGKPVDVIPLKSHTPAVANGATVVVLFEQLGLLFPSEIDSFPVSQQLL